MKRRTLLSLPFVPALPLAAAGCATPSPQAVLTRVETALGHFVIAVDPARAPVTVANYLAYVDAQQLDGGSVYRIVTLANQAPSTRHKIEVVQWGLNPPEGRAPLRPPVLHETTEQTGLKHRDGTVSMARLAPGTASSEFFICIGDQPELDFGGGRNPDGQGFAAFGQVVAGRDVVKALHARGQADTQYPQPAISVLRVRRVAPLPNDAPR